MSPVTPINNAELGLGLAPRKPRSDMDGGMEKELVPKRKSNSVVEAAGDESNDDERPIVSLLKQKRSRSVKKGRRPGQDARVQENPRAEDGDLGEMDDTLASFRKKLKTSKRVKGGGSGATRVKDSSPLDQEDVEDLSKPPRRKSRTASMKKNAKEGILENADDSFDDGFEDSLSAFVQKAHASSVQRVRLVPNRKKQMEGTSGSGDGLEKTSNVVSDDLLSAHIGRSSRSQGAVMPASGGMLKKLAPNKRGRKTPGKPAVELTEVSTMIDGQFDRTSDDETLEETLHIVVGKTHSLLGRRGKMGNQRPANGSSCTPGWVQSESLYGSTQEFSPVSGVEVTIEPTKSSGDSFGRSTEGNSENSVPALPQIPNSNTLLGAKEKSETLKDEGLDTVSEHDICFNKSCNGTTSKGLLSGTVQGPCSFSIINRKTEETQRLEDGFKQCSNGKSGNLLSSAFEISTTSVPRQTEEIHDFDHNVELKGQSERTSKGSPPTFVVMSPLSLDISNEPGGIHYDLVQDSCSVHVEQMSEEPITSGDELNESLEHVIEKEVKVSLDGNRLNGPFEETQKEVCVRDDCINQLYVKTSEEQPPPIEKFYVSSRNLSKETKRQDEMLEPYGENLKVSLLPSFDQNTSPSSIPMKLEGICCPHDGFSQQHVKHLDHLSLSPYVSVKKEKIPNSKEGLNQLSKIAFADSASIVKQKSHFTSVTVHVTGTPGVDDGLLQSSDSILLVKPSEEVQQCVLASTADYEKELPAAGDLFNQFPERIPLVNEHSDDSFKGTSSTIVHDPLIVKETNSTGSQDMIPTLKEFHPADAAVVSDTDIGIEDKMQKTLPRATRKVKKPRHGDMTYEGDVDWEVLMRDQGFFGNTTAFDGELSTRTKDKFDSSANLQVDAQDGSSAAVAAGLKAGAAGPIEKIKFKEVLKHKGGLQEYLECRNLILGLWSKDASHILPLEDCGVTGSPSKEEPPRSSLIREIYFFLDCSGYINAGIASNKEKRQPYGMPHSEFSKGNVLKKTCGGQVADSEDEVAYIFNQVALSENVNAAKNNIFLEDEKTSLLDKKAKIEELAVHSMGPELSTQIGSGEHQVGNVELDEQPECQISVTQPLVGDSIVDKICSDWKARQVGGSCNLVMNGRGVESGEYAVGDEKPVCLTSVKQQFGSDNIMAEMCSNWETISMGQSCSLVMGDQEIAFRDTQLRNEMATLDPISSDPPTNIVGCRQNSILSLKHIETLSTKHQTVEIDKEVKHVEIAGADSAIHHLDVDYSTQCNLEEVRKKIIVVGAGPAGLTAARHLQRQGFSATVLEARGRIGGRVYTDCSSLSVPVDLGASIITGVEADVATERRADPSSLVCAQLGLELTILNSDCPLYDVVTGQKVPAGLDEALEAEYNSLLDDMVVLVAQNGEGATRMSLEDGLEYALKKRRMARLTSAAVDPEQLKIVGDSRVLDSSGSAPIITGNGIDKKVVGGSGLTEDVLSPLERRVMDWHLANLEYGCAALLKEVSLPHWNQDDVYGGFGGAHCMIKGGYSTVMETLGEGLNIQLKHVVTDIMYNTKNSDATGQRQTEVKVTTAGGGEFVGDAVLITVPLGCLKANAIKFSPVLPDWKQSSIHRLGFGVLNKVVLEFPEVFWDDNVDYFGATSEETGRRGQCFMFWNVKKTVGAPVLIALVVGKAAIDGQNISTSDHVNYALKVLRKLFGETSVPDPVASVVTNWGMDPFSKGAYSYVAVGASGEDYDNLGRPVANCLFFAGEATCKEHPDTVGGAMMSGLREAVRIIDIFNTGNDYTAEVETMEAAQRQADSERNEVKDIAKRLDSCKLSHVTLLTKEALLQDMFCNTQTTAGRLHLAKEMLRLPVEVLKSFAGTKEGLSILNSWILDSMGKDATQLLRHCVRLLVLISTNLLAVRLSGIGKTVKEKVCVHTSRDIRAIASQLVNVWIEVFRKEKAANGGLKLLRQSATSDSSKLRSKDMSAGKPPLHVTNEVSDSRGNLQVPSFAGSYSSSNGNNKKGDCRMAKLESLTDIKSEINSSHSQRVTQGLDSEDDIAKSKALAAAEAARAAKAARAAAEVDPLQAYASSEADCSTSRELPKIPSFHKFVRREQYAHIDESDLRRKKWSGGILGRQDCISDIDSRNCKVRNWPVDFSATCANLDGSRLSGDNHTQRSYSNEITCPINLREHSGESEAVDSRLTRAWVDTDAAGSGGVKDYLAIERWQSQAMDAEAQFFNPLHVKVEEDSNMILKLPMGKHQRPTGGSSASQAGESKSLVEGQPRGAEHIKQGVVDYVASLLMPLYRTSKIDKEGYKSIMKKSVTKVMEQCTEAEKLMTIFEFLDYKRKNKIRSFVDKLIERHMSGNPSMNH